MASSIPSLLRNLIRPTGYYKWGVKNILSNLKGCEVYQVRHAARKGTRERKKKKACKVEPKTTTFIPHHLRDRKLKTPIMLYHVDDSKKKFPKDNVWFSRFFRYPVYDFADAVQCHRETHHPTMYNLPNAPLNVIVNLDRQAAKKNRYIDNFKRMVPLPHPFDQGVDRSILVFCKATEMQKQALEAGATVAGGLELIKDVQSGDLVLQDFEYLLAHPDILPELVMLRGLMKRKFPNVQTGTLHSNVSEMVIKFKNGVKYTSSSDERKPEFGWVETKIGSLSMDVSHLEANLAALLQDINCARPKREGPFIISCLLVCPPSVEKFKLNLEPYLEAEKPGEQVFSDGEDETEEVQLSMS